MKLIEESFRINANRTSRLPAHYPITHQRQLHRKFDERIAVLVAGCMNSSRIQMSHVQAIFSPLFDLLSVLYVQIDAGRLEAVTFSTLHRIGQSIDRLLTQEHATLEQIHPSRYVLVKHLSQLHHFSAFRWVERRSIWRL